MNILILGSQGFIGSSCISYFTTLGHKVFGADLQDIKNPSYTYYKISRLNPNFDSIFIKHQYDLCINAAGNGSVPISVENPQIDFESNVVDTFQLLECIRKHNAQCKIIYFSSAAVYGNPVKLPITETDKVCPISPYGWHKLIGEKLMEEYFYLYGIKSVCLRPFSVYGPGLRKQLIWDIYQKAQKGKSIELFGTGNETRDFIYIEDLMKIIELAASKLDFDTLNAASGVELSIKDLIDIFIKLSTNTYTFYFNNIMKQGDPLNWRADISKLRAMGFKPEFTFEEGLKKTLKWLEYEA